LPWNHFYGGFAVIWGLAAWAEWFVTPMLFPQSGGPVPYIMFVPLVVALFLGCCWLVGSMWTVMPRLSPPQRLIYSVAPGSYVIYQLTLLAL